MTVGLLIVLGCILILPFAFRIIEHNLEYFLFIMGILAVVISGELSTELVLHVFQNYLLYLITGAVLIAGLIFRVSVNKIRKMVETLLRKIPLKLFIFLLILILGFVSSFITAIIASLILVEIIHALPFKHKDKVLLAVIACFAIGLGAALTPIGEPLSTIVTSKMSANFFFLFNSIGIYIIIGIVGLAAFGAFYVDYMQKKSNSKTDEQEEKEICDYKENVIEIESMKEVIIRAVKIFIFVVALELLGAGFKPLINNYIIHLDSRLLYWINMTSAVLDNATLAAAEISPAMDINQIKAILMGLLLSGGMLIPGNIPNIISAGKLNIKSREWAVIGLPLGVILLGVYYLVLFVF